VTRSLWSYVWHLLVHRKNGNGVESRLSGLGERFSLQNRDRIDRLSGSRYKFRRDRRSAQLLGRRLLFIDAASKETMDHPRLFIYDVQAVAQYFTIPHSPFYMISETACASPKPRTHTSSALKSLSLTLSSALLSRFLSSLFV